MKGIGEVSVQVPRDRKGAFRTEVLPRGKQYEDVLREDLCTMFLAGVSTRTLSILSERLIGRKISPMEVSNAGKELTEAVEAWRERDLSKEPIKYLYVDGTLFSMRHIDGSVEKVPVLVVIGVTLGGHRTVLAVQAGDKESASTWRELFKDIKRRGPGFQPSGFGHYGRLAGTGESLPGGIFQCSGPEVPGPCCTERPGQGAEEAKKDRCRRGTFHLLCLFKEESFVLF